MTDQVTATPEAATPSPEAQALIADIFHQPPINRPLQAPAADTSTDTAQQPSPAATDPQTGHQEAPQPNGLQADGQPAPTEDARQQQAVPPWRLKEESDRRRAAETELADVRQRAAYFEGLAAAAQRQPVQQPQAPVDPNPLPSQFRSAAEYMLADPDGHAAWVEQRATHAARTAAQTQVDAIQKTVTKQAWQSDEMRARQQFGDKHVDEVKAYVAKHPDLARHFSQGSTPFTSAAAWARDQQVKQAIPNGDIEAFKKAAIIEALSNPAILQAIAPHLGRAPQPQSVPPSLSNQPRAGFRGPVMSVQDDIDQIFASRRS